MGLFNFEDPDFLQKIRGKAWEIIEQSKNEILDHPNFPILVNNHLLNFWLSRADRRDIFVLSLSETDLMNLELDKVEDSINSSIREKLKTHSFLTVNSRFEIIQESAIPFEGTQQGREYLIELSKKGKCIFFFGEKGISRFIQGAEKGDNIFLTTTDRINHSEKFELTDIAKAIEKYKNQHLTRQNNYVKFFESKRNLIAIYGDPAYKSKKNLLKNSPEKYFRDDLIDFLNENVKGTFNREMQLLSSKKPIDIHTESKGDSRLVFFEVKWLGVSKHKDKMAEGTSYINTEANARANEGVVQTLEYIEEVVEKMNRDLACGYLVIFDARNVVEHITYNTDATLPENLRKYYRDKFSKFDNLIVVNIHPCD